MLKEFRFLNWGASAAPYARHGVDKRCGPRFDTVIGYRLSGRKPLQRESIEEPINLSLTLVQSRARRRRVVGLRPVSRREGSRGNVRARGGVQT